MILLGKEHYKKLNNLLNQVNFNRLFATAVIDQKVHGRVYVDDANTPRTFYIVHNYGMSLLGGDHTNSEFNAAFREYALNTDKKRTHHEWMQVFPNEWNAALKDLLRDSLIKSGDNKENETSEVIELNTRVNFVFDKDRYFEAREELINKNPKIKIVESTADIFGEMEGSVVPEAFWNSPTDFRSAGVAFSLYVEGKLAATSFSSFLAPGKLELGIETIAEFRNKGLAEKVCAAMIDYCIERKTEPIWACRLENTGSYKLAQKLGFVPTMELPYYRLSN
ncbi:MAG TPA: GNAT family N-acetyltransferase [Cyclobacteriaceae bacterium]|nr:GNAT family N-acetyltransferase [Cyclobacteriaceae bacterium]